MKLLNPHWRTGVVLCVLVVFSWNVARAQVLFEAPMGTNPELRDQAEPASVRFKAPLQLPFFEDFSRPGPYPRQDHWEGFQVYVNDHFAIDPPSIGVATFDGLNSAGQAYNPDAPDQASLPVDTLTSRPIDLNGLRDVDSVVLSFFYQATGRGEQINAQDSLVLEFLADSVVAYLSPAREQIDTILRNQWLPVWSRQGPRPRDQFNYVSLQVPFDSSRAFYHEGFRFRFRAFGSATGAGDHWHLDYLTLDKGRESNAEPFYNDIAVYRRPLGFLTEYTRIPLSHYNEDPGRFFRQTDTLYVRNLRNTAQTIRNGITFRDVDTDQDLQRTTDISSLFDESGGLGLNYALKGPNASAPVFLSRDKAVLEMEHRVNIGSPTGDSRPENDTLRFRQILAYDYAYDDGSAESSLGFREVRDEARFALKFVPAKSDQLQGVGLMFNQFLGPVVGQTFDINIWTAIAEEGPDDNDELAYAFEDVEVSFPNDNNGFAYFELPDPVRVRANQAFYIGWSQTEDFRLLIGLDKNYVDFKPPGQNANSLPFHPEMFFFVSDRWNRVPDTVFRGAPMIRAYMADETIPDNPNPDLDKTPDDEEARFVLAPNPVRGTTVGLEAQASAGRYDILTPAGALLRTGRYEEGNNSLDLSGLQTGLYLIRLIPDADDQYPSLLRLLIR